MQTMEVNKDYRKTQEIESLEKKSKPVDEEKSIISDKTLITLEG